MKLDIMLIDENGIIWVVLFKLCIWIDLMVIFFMVLVVFVIVMMLFLFMVFLI